MPHFNTLRVYKSTPRADTLRVQSLTMKTVGERIREAREWRGISGDQLAKQVGYKHQSAIGNLENRAGGTGGKKIAKIADALNVPVAWLLSGPDGDNIPFLPPKIQLAEVRHLSFEAREPSKHHDYDEATQDAINIMLDLPAADRRGAVAALRTHVQNLVTPTKQTTPAQDGTTA